jgi:hypothetical protein
VEANSTGGQGSRRAVASIDGYEVGKMLCISVICGAHILHCLTL